MALHSNDAPWLCKRCPSFFDKFRPCLRRNADPPGEYSSRWDRIKYTFLMPPHGKVAMWITKFVGALLIWATCWAITGKEALVGGNFFALLILVYACVIAAALVSLTPLPPLVGMLLMGFALRNIPKINVGKDIHQDWAASLRTLALVVILLKAGVGLDPKALRKTKWLALRLAFFPCLVEAVLDAVIAHFMIGFPWVWAFVMGFVLSAVSPAVVVPSMTALQEKGWGTDKGIPTLCIAACSINDVIAISCFGVVLGTAFSDSHLVYNIFHGPIEFLMGAVYGIVVGLFLWYIPNKNSKNLLIYRFTLLAAAGMFATFGFRMAKFPGAGTLATLIVAFVCGVGWRKRGWTSSHLPIKNVFNQIWKVFQPLLFGLIGNTVSLENLQSGSIGLGVAMLFIGLVLRLLVTFFCTFGMNLNWKEKIFITIAWLPKATVQAAIGPVALDTAIKHNASEEIIGFTTQILTFAVLSIIITAPLGAAGIGLSAPHLLNRDGGNPDLAEAGATNQGFEEEKSDRASGENNNSQTKL